MQDYPLVCFSLFIYNFNYLFNPLVAHEVKRYFYNRPVLTVEKILDFILPLLGLSIDLYDYNKIFRLAFLTTCLRFS